MNLPAPDVIVNVPQPPKRRARKRMVAGMRVSGKHGEYTVAIEGGRKSRKRIYGYVMEASGNNKYLVRFDCNMEKECFSNTLNIEADEATVPQDEAVPEVVLNNEAIAADKDSESDNESSDGELASEHGIVNIGDINESADIPEDNVNEDEVETDARPETYHDRLRGTRAAISRLIGDEVSIKGTGGEITWTVIKNHTKPELSEESREAEKEHMKNVGYNNIKQLLQTEKFEDPAAASDDGTSNSNTPHRPRDIEQCTMFAMMFLTLTFKNWRSKYTKFNECINLYNDKNPKAVKEFSLCEYLTCFALFIGAVVFSASGARLWDIKGDSKQRDMEWASIVQPPGYDEHIKLYRFKQFRMIIHKTYEQNDLADTDPWWRFKGAIDEFNAIRKVRYFVVPFFIVFKVLTLFFCR